jgi:hypothetical protein
MFGGAKFVNKHFGDVTDDALPLFVQILLMKVIKACRPATDGEGSSVRT